jgi:hypothetical protein
MWSVFCLQTRKLFFCVSELIIFDVSDPTVSPGRQVPAVWWVPFHAKIGIKVTKLPSGQSQLRDSARNRTRSFGMGDTASSCEVWGFYGGDYEECRLLGYKHTVGTSQEIPYVSTTESSRLMLCKIWGFHGGDYEECRLLESDAVWIL